MARLEDIGGPKAHNNFPHGWAMASNTPLRRYKQNTHGGGIRDPIHRLVAQGHSRAASCAISFATSATSYLRTALGSAFTRRAPLLHASPGGIRRHAAL